MKSNIPFFDETENEVEDTKNAGLKSVSSSKSIFDSIPKKPTRDSLKQKIGEMQETTSSYKKKISDLTKKFLSFINDKTLKENRDPFQESLEKETISQLTDLASQINEDPSEREGMGSLLLSTILMKIVFQQRDKINNLEYRISKLEKK